MKKVLISPILVSMILVSYFYNTLPRRYISVSKNVMELDKCSPLLWCQNDVWGLKSMGHKSNNHLKENSFEPDIGLLQLWRLKS